MARAWKSNKTVLISGYLKDKDFSHEQQQHLKVADALQPIREDYISLLTDFETLEEKDIAEQREKLKKATAKIYDGAIQTDARSYAEAQKQLKYKEHQFFTRDELNKILPEHLRHQYVMEGVIIWQYLSLQKKVLLKH